jgi:hypothetical protein
VKRWFAVLLGSLAAVAGIASVVTRPVPAPQASAPLLAGAHVDPTVFATLRRSCADCHSEATRFRWYSYVWPISTWTTRHVAEGRLHLNFSRWAEYSKWRKERSLSEIANQVEDGDMPLRQYTWMHPEAKLTPQQARAVFDWTQRERLRLIQEGDK